MAIDNDFTYNTTAKTISHVGGQTTRWSVNALYSWLQDAFDDQGQMDDVVPMAAFTPTEYALVNGWTFGSDNDVAYLYGGSIKVNSTDGNPAHYDLWANVYSIGTIEAGTKVYLKQGTTLIGGLGNVDPDASPTYNITYTSGHIDQLVKVVSAGVDQYGRKVTAFARNLSDSFDHFEITAPTTGGRNPVPLATADDSNNQTAEGTLAALGITVSFGSYSQNIGDGAANYVASINCNGQRLSKVYEYLKYVTRNDSATSFTNVPGQGTVAAKFYTRADPSYAEIKPAPFGTYAGGKFFGARGVYIHSFDAADSNAYILTDTAGAQHTPPTSIAIKVDGLLAGDRVFLARTNAGAIWKDQYTIASRTATTIVVVEDVTADVPATGVIRVGDIPYSYTSVNAGTKTFTFPAATIPVDSTTAPGVKCYNPILDELATGTSVSKSVIYVDDIAVKTRVRRYGILPFEVDGTVINTGLTVSAIRTTDSIVTPV